FFGGFHNRFSYKKVSLEALFQFTKQLGMDYRATSGIVGGMANQLQDVMGRWQMEGDQTGTQRFTTGVNLDALNAYRNYIVSDVVVSDAAYIRLKTLSLSYAVSLPEKTSLGCEVFLRGQNLWTWTRYNGL